MIGQESIADDNICYNDNKNNNTRRLQHKIF